MKRKKLLGSLFLGITLAFTAVGCGSDNDSAAPKERSEGPVLTQEQQKQQLDATARKFMGSIHPDDFRELVLIQQVGEEEAEGLRIPTGAAQHRVYVSAEGIWQLGEHFV